MSHTRITIDGNTILDTNQVQSLPEQITQLTTPGTQPQPWMKAILIALADALHHQQPITINVTTTNHGWTMDVAA